MTAWVEVLVTMSDGPRLPVRGTIRKSPDRPERINFAYAGEAPLYVAVGGDVHVWRDGPGMRIETLDGRPVFITDGESAWQFDGTGDPPLRSDARRVRYLGSGRELLVNRPAHEWLGDDYTRPAGPIEETTFLGRDCWAVDLAPGPRKSGVLRIVVDRESGVELEQRNVAADVRVAYADLTIGEPVDAGLFTWTGAERDFDEDRRQRAERDRAEDDRRLEWFRATVAADLPAVRVPLTPRVEAVHTLDETTGAFRASITAGLVSGMLARRVRSAEPWNLKWPGTVARWATSGFEWAVTLHGVDLDAAALGALQRALHPGQATIPAATA
ncbi:LolA family protein [Rhodococcus sp. SGAir0479]|uniref:LolA family protein n=1 Tax=Rhodococcus sp. SGAir0479 TaxID=2567884 RepID=UPI0010CD62C4|nr:hypothetical protein [Rhodococcus sp. SGAir0479]QCQ92324.1 hypothetical protein E7742_14585 [Rhodococcus sp. SGAir0479]